MFIFRKARTSNQTLNDLNAYINGIGDKPVKWLAREVQSWGEFSYAELERVIADGRLAELIDWQERYADVVNGTLAPLWSAAMIAAAQKATKGKTIFYDSDIAVKDWIRQHGGELITQLSDESRKALAAIILYGQSTNNFYPKEIARQIRPLIGLTERQVSANLNYREKVFNQYRENGASVMSANEQADKAAQRYASHQHRQRAETIVHTELAFAYNQGAHVGVMQAIQGGLMGHCEMVWTTAGTNRVCPRCLALKGTVVGHTNESGVQIPPIHPRCRCTIEYREIEKPQAVKPQKTFKEEITELRQTLSTQRTQGASAAEMETTIKAAGKLVSDRVKATKIFDLPPAEKIDIDLMRQTLLDLQSKYYAATPSERTTMWEIYDKALIEYSDLRNKQKLATVKLQTERAEQLKAILSEVRQMGATKEQFKAQFGTSRSKTRKVVETAMNFYPSDWIEKSVQRGTLKPINPKNGRGYYSDYYKQIAVAPDSEERIATAIHEFGHRMEHAESEILKAEQEFYNRRTAGESLERLSVLTGNRGYGNSEIARKDKFLHVYMGKDYGGSAYELVSMGFEYAYTNPELLLQDADMAEWIYGLLALY